MRSIQMRTLTRTIKRVLSEHGPLVGIITGAVGFTGAIGLTAKATVQAVRRTDYETEKKGGKLTAKELIELNWRYYFGPAILWIGSVISLCFAARGYKSSVKLLATLYAASEAERKRLEEIALEKLGPKKFDEMKDEVAQNRLNMDPVSAHTIYDTGTGVWLCYDSLSGRYFRSSSDHIERAVNRFNNYILTHQAGKSYNDLFYEISPVFSDIEFGKDVGWGYEKGVVDIRYSTHRADNGEPCLVLEYRIPPYKDFDW